MSTALNVNTGVSVPVSGVGKFFRFLLHPLFLALLGVIAISALVWYRRPADRDRRIAGRSTRPGSASPSSPSCSACCCLRAIFRAAGSQRRANAALVEGMTKGPSSADKEIATLNQRFGEALDVLKKTAAARRKLGGATSTSCPGTSSSARPARARPRR